MGKTDENRHELIKSLQRFNSPDWSDINFIDIQKSYLSKPGLVALETHDDLKPFDKNKFLPSCESTLAAVTNAILRQREVLQKNITDLLCFVKGTREISFEDFSVKVNELFCNNDEYNKISKDLMQIVCGKRASIINNRRTELLKSVQSNYTSDKFNKIPPSSDLLFEPDQFTKLLEREGGPSKVFVKPFTPKKKVNYANWSKNSWYNDKFSHSLPSTSTSQPSWHSKQSFRGKRKREREPKKYSGRRNGDSKRRRHY